MGAKEKLLEKIKVYAKAHKMNVKRIIEAYELADHLHKPQVRKSGEPYIIHPLTVACYLIEYGADEVSIIAALLHDTAEDTEITLREIENLFGTEIAGIVDGMTKLPKDAGYQSEDMDSKVESLRKMFGLMQNDIRIIVIKLFDRLHNLQTLGVMSAEKVKSIAEETLEVYVVLASHLGIWNLKQQMEDLCFMYLYPKEYERFKKLNADADVIRKSKLLPIQKKLLKLDKQKKIKRVALITKSLWSLYQQSQLTNSTDFLSHKITFKLIVADVEDCYTILSYVHGLGQVKRGGVSDYIAMPHENRYQSLLTSVIDEKGDTLKFHIRTEDMDRQAEQGVLSFCFGDHTVDLRPQFRWLKNISTLDRESKTESKQFWESLKNDILKERIFVIGDKGRIIRLPRSSTVLDYLFQAYPDDQVPFLAEVLINALPGPLNYVLQGGEHLKVVFGKDSKLDISWLSLASNEFTRGRVRSLLRKEIGQDKVLQGERLLQNEFDRYKLGFVSEISKTVIKKFLDHFKVHSWESVLIQIAEGDISVEEIRNIVLKGTSISHKSLQYLEMIYVTISRQSTPKVLTDIFQLFADNKVDYQHLSTVLKKPNAIDTFRIKVTKLHAYNQLIHNLKIVPGIYKIQREFPRQRNLAIVYMVIVALIWGLNPLVIAYLGQQDMSATLMTGIRLWSGAVFLYCLIGMKQLFNWVSYARIHFNFLFFLCVIFLIFDIYFINYSVLLASPIFYIIYAHASPMLMGIVQNSTSMKKLSIYIPGFILAVLACIVVNYSIVPKAMISQNMAAFAALIFFVGYSILFQKFQTREKIQKRTLWVLAHFHIFAALLFSIVLPWSELLHTSMSNILVAVILGILSSSVCYVLFFEAQKYLSDFAVSMFLNLIVVVLIIGTLFVSEISIAEIVSSVMIILAVTLTAYREKPGILIAAK